MAPSSRTKVSTSSSTTARSTPERIGEVVDQLAQRGIAVEELEDQRGGGVEHGQLGGAADDDLVVADGHDLELGHEVGDEFEVDVVGRQRIGERLHCRTRLRGGRRHSVSPGSERPTVENCTCRGGGLGGDADGIEHVVVIRLVRDVAGILEAVPIPADAPE